jgi:hypothetical protein
MSGAEKTVMGVCFDAEKDQTKMIGYGWHHHNIPIFEPKVGIVEYTK